MTYAKIVKLLRNKLVLSQTELANLIGCSFASVNRWENGIHEPSYKMKRQILKLAKKNKIPTEDE